MLLAKVECFYAISLKDVMVKIEELKIRLCVY